MKTLNAELVAVGTELLLGNTANTDAQTLSEGLSELGVNVYYHTVVGDNPERLSRAIEIAKSRADVIITTGGLGPTVDDLTKQTVAACFGKQLAFHEDIADTIRSYFDKINRPMTENNLRQACLPEGCTVFENSWGTAPGCAFEAHGKHVLMLPGPPSECNAMFEKHGKPYLRRLSDKTLYSCSVRIFGLGESHVEEMLHDMMENMTNPTVAPYAKEGEVMVRVTAGAESMEKARQMTEPVVEDIRRILGDTVYSTEKSSLEETALCLLREQGKTVALAESCTGGFLAKRLTDIPGASEVFVGGVVAYSDQVKTACLGVPEQLLKDHGAVSEQAAYAMAQGARQRLSADLGVGITGIAGPGNDSDVKSVGTVYVALATGSGQWCRRLNLGVSRNRTRTTACNHALDMVRRFLTDLDIVK